MPYNVAAPLLGGAPDSRRRKVLRGSLQPVGDEALSFAEFNRLARLRRSWRGMKACSTLLNMRAIVISLNVVEATLAQIIVRKLEESVRDQLRKRAKRLGRSVEEEVRDILRMAAAQEDDAAMQPLGSRISARFGACGLAPDERLAEPPSQNARPAIFE
ncbi:FitA-like ribbon-helix-helix domain-containing protein [Lichenicoccus sp.]|uniref:FitA-like ribbon-helix-helix domain-containing protein n=1 Tax=Lichenicoccus sp. TaxID=2781899 RepID=UPI003D148BB7